MRRRAAVGSALSVSPALGVFVRHINKAAVNEKKKRAKRKLKHEK